MADPSVPTRSSSKLPLVLGGVAALLGAAAGYGAVTFGMVPGLGQDVAVAEGEAPVAMTPVSANFLPIETIVVSLAGDGSAGDLRFAGSIEVTKGAETAVAHVMPRIVDVLNGYLRAVEINDLRDPAALMRLRAQMLRRIQTVTGQGQVRDLLVTQFVLT